MTNKIIRPIVASNKKFNMYEIETDKNNNKWYYLRIYSAEIRRWVKTCNVSLWKRTECMTIVDYAIKEELYTMFVLKWEA
jgi:hypothetical protein